MHGSDCPRKPPGLRISDCSERTAGRLPCMTPCPHFLLGCAASHLRVGQPQTLCVRCTVPCSLRVQTDGSASVADRCLQQQAMTQLGTFTDSCSHYSEFPGLCQAFARILSNAHLFFGSLYKSPVRFLCILSYRQLLCAIVHCTFSQPPHCFSEAAHKTDTSARYNQHHGTVCTFRLPFTAYLCCVHIPFTKICNNKKVSVS